MKKILIIDDNPFSTFLLMETLEKRKYKIIDIDENRNIASVIENEKPDLIILDIVMPKKSGFEILKEIKDIPVVVVSSLNNDKTREKAIKLGAKHFIEKPFNPKVLNQIIKEEMDYIN